MDEQTIEQGTDPQTGEPEICLRNKRTPLLAWELSRWRDSEIGGLDLLRRAPVERSVDFEFGISKRHTLSPSCVFTSRPASVSDSRLR